MTGRDAVFADADGVLFTPMQQVQEILLAAGALWMKERQQAEGIRAGKKLREQLQFDEYLAQRSTDETYTFRQHLHSIGGAIEE